MDVENLIREVFSRPPLWDKKDKNHHNRFALDRLWNEVAQKAQTNPTVVRSKWKALRDKFRTTLVSILEPKSGGAEVTDYKGEWRYFKSLFFLKDQFTNRSSSGNTSHGSVLNETDEGNIDNEAQQDCSTEQSSVESPGGASSIHSETPSSLFSTSAVQRRKSEKRNLDETLFQLEKEKLQYLKQKRAKKEEDDEDLSFFKSLLPHVRTLTAFEKMEFRMKVLKVTQEFVKPRQGIFPAAQNITTDNHYSSTSNESTTARDYSDNIGSSLDLYEGY